jgi:hypothetical protein
MLDLLLRSPEQAVDRLAAWSAQTASALDLTWA